MLGRARIATASGALLAAALLGAVWTCPALAVEISGKVVAVSGDEVRIQIEGEDLPRVGDPVVLGFRIPAGALLRVGTWRVTGVEEETVVATVVEATGKPAVGHAATISSDSPIRPPRPLVGEPPQSQGQREALPPAPAQGVDVTVRELQVVSAGPVITERVGDAYVMRAAPGNPGVVWVARRAALAFRAAVRVKNIEFGEGKWRAAGLLMHRASAGQSAEQDILFALLQLTSGKQGLALWRHMDRRWVHLFAGPLRPFTIHPPDQGQWLEITRRGGRYEFRFNDTVVLEWEAPERDADWIGLWTGDGVRAEFEGWRVESLE